MSIQALREQRGKIAMALQDLVKKETWDDAVDQPAYDKGMADIDAIDAKVSRIQAANEKLAADTLTDSVAEQADRKGRNGNDAGLSIYAKWLRGGDRALNVDDWAHVRNTMSTTTGSEGGFTVPSDVSASVIEALKAYGGMRAVAEVISTAGGGALSYPTSDGTAEEGEIVPENASATDADLSFGTVSLSVFKFSSKVVAVPLELLQDSAIDIDAFVRMRLVTRIGRVTNKLFTRGTGVAQPNGIQTAATIGVTAANSTSQVTAVVYDSLVDVQHSVDPAYRERGNMAWMFNDATMKAIRKIKDTVGLPIFVPGYEFPGGAPDSLLGSPIRINQDMPDMAASVKSILYGDFRGYTIRDVMSVQLFRFEDSAYTKKGQVGFLGWARSGGNLTDIGAVRAFRNAAS